MMCNELYCNILNCAVAIKSQPACLCVCICLSDCVCLVYAMVKYNMVVVLNTLKFSCQRFKTLNYSNYLKSLRGFNSGTVLLFS